ncbi:unnamed protein product, partial [Mesorhabditis spiculigera]
MGQSADRSVAEGKDLTASALGMAIIILAMLPLPEGDSANIYSTVQYSILLLVSLGGNRRSRRSDVKEPRRLSASPRLPCRFSPRSVKTDSSRACGSGKAEVAKLYAGTTAESFEEDLVRKPGTGRPKRQVRERSPSPSTAKPKMLTRSKREDATKEYPPCVRCKCTSFRVVDPGRPDRKRVIECRNMDCLASIAYTELEEGELLGAQEEVEYGWYLRDWEEIYYPKVNEEQRWIGSLW